MQVLNTSRKHSFLKDVVTIDVKESTSVISGDPTVDRAIAAVMADGFPHIEQSQGEEEPGVVLAYGSRRKLQRLDDRSGSGNGSGG